MEGVCVPNLKNDVVIEGRKMLGDISNVPRKPSILNQDNKARPNSSTVKEYIEQLQKENAALVKLLVDRNRVIELSGAEVHKLKITLEKMQQQNIQFAQSNSQMLAELNSRKDRLKDLQHQLGCKNALLVAKQKEMEKLKVSEDKGMGVCLVAESEKDQHCNTNGRQKSKSLVPSVRKVQEQGMGDNGRLQTRRQSARFKHEEPKPKEVVIHTDNVDLAPCSLSDDRMQEDDLNSSNLSVKKEDVDNDSRPSISNKITQGSRRSSISRPSREAAKKVQSYKEISLHVKLRRPE